jgi:hypothetical protein
MKDSPFEALARYCDRELEQPLALHLLAHTRDALESGNLTPPELADRLGEDVYMMLFTVVLEDFISRPEAPGGVRVADAYLKRHGWKITPSARRLIQAVRDSALSLYEVTEVYSGVGLDVRDLLLDQPAFTVEHPGLSDALPVGCALGARVLRLDDTVTLSGGILPFDAGLGEAAVRDIRAAADIGDRPLDAADLPGLAPHISNVWLKITLQEAAEGDGDEGTDGDLIETD